MTIIAVVKCFSAETKAVITTVISLKMSIFFDQSMIQTYLDQIEKQQNTLRKKAFIPF